MTIIEIKKLPNGAHDNQTWDINYPTPDGYAVIPEDMETPNFPFGDITTKKIDGVLTVTKWTPLPVPEVEPVKPQPTQLDLLQSQVTWLALNTGNAQILNQQGDSANV